jgi:long-chain acyl-CoA synthetase
LSRLTKVFSGGAPIAPPVVEQFEALTGIYIHNCYGLTETTSPSHAVPLGRRAPVDAATGALSVGIPVPNTDVRVVEVGGEGDRETGEQGDREAGKQAEKEGGEEREAIGGLGEFATRGPEVVPGYWGKAAETAHAIRDGYLHTGDIGRMDEAGWFYIVDRKKDMIVASGFKVWPREVEDVLYQHPAVREAAVIGVPDPYRGETVKAFVSLKPGATATAETLVAFCRERLATYKAPRQIEIRDEIPKTVTGKILRRALRET